MRLSNGCESGVREVEERDRERTIKRWGGSEGDGAVLLEGVDGVEGGLLH